METVTFRCPDGSQFALPFEWWKEAGMDQFRATADHYLESEPADGLVPLAEIETPITGSGNDLALGKFDRTRMVNALTYIARGQPMLPIRVRQGDNQPSLFILQDGVHRYYASAAAGFTHIPVNWNWLLES